MNEAETWMAAYQEGKEAGIEAGIVEALRDVAAAIRESGGGNISLFEETEQLVADTLQAEAEERERKARVKG